MKALIIYDTKYGATEDAARLLAQEMDAELHKAGENISPADFDAVIIGSPVYISKLRKPVVEYCKRFEKPLQGKRLAFFLVHGRTEEPVADVLRANLSPGLVDIAKTADFGGEYRMDKMGFLDKKMISMVAKSEGGLNNPSINKEAIREFAASMV